MLGHNWSPYLKFKGGKGVAVFFGGWIAMCPLIVAVGAVIIVPTVFITRTMSRGSILAALGTMLACMIMTVFFKVTPVYLVYSVLAAAIIVFQHRSNIARLQRGTELKLGNEVFKGPKPGAGAK